MKYLIELVADAKGIEPAITAIDELNQAEKELKTTTISGNAEQKKMMEEYAAKAKLGKASIDKLTEGYKQLGKAATGAFGGEAIKGAAKQAESFRTQLRVSRDELTRLLQTGKASTSEIYNMARGAGQLKDSVNDAQRVISVLSSDTFKFDAALQGLQVGAAGFQVLSGSAALFGSESEDLQKTLVKLNAVMAITSGLQQIVNLGQKESAFRLGLSVAAQRAYTVVVGESTGAMKVFKVALASTGIGLLVIALGALITNWKSFTSAIGISSEKLEKFSEKLRMLKDGIVGFFKGAGEIIKDILKGDFSEAYNDAKRIGETIADNIKKGIIERRIDKLLNDTIEKSAIAKRLYEIKGDERNVLIEDIKSTYAIALQESAKYNKDKNKETKKSYDEATLDYLAAQQALSDFDKEAYKKRVEEEKKRYEERKKKLEEENRFNAEIMLERMAKEKQMLDKNLKSFQDTEKKKQEAAAETNRILQEQYNAQIAANEINLQKTIDALNEINKIKQEDYEKEKKAQEDKELAIKDASVQIAQQTADAIFTIVNQRRNDEFNLQIQRLNELKSKELSNKELTDAQKERIELRYQRQIAAIKTKQAQADKAAAIAQAIINGALAITKIFTSVTALNPASFAAIAVTAATTAAQIAIIGAQKIPKFAKGTEYVKGGGTETSDSIPAMLSKGERVIDAKTNKLLKGIPNKLIPDLLIPQATMIKEGMDYDKLAKAFSKELASNPALMVNFDKQGFTTFIKSGVTVSQIKNNRNGV